MKNEKEMFSSKPMIYGSVTAIVSKNDGSMFGSWSWAIRH